MSDYRAKILADSESKTGQRLTTMEVTFPRLVLAEFNTHRAFSRNSASSRAIPVEKQLDRIARSPFVPKEWGQNQPGMQAEVTIQSDSADRATALWQGALSDVLLWTRGLVQLNVHKQLANRLLEPFMWQTVIVTATEWSNFFALRANPMAQPEIRTIAELMQDTYLAHQPRLVNEGDWHLPLIQPDEMDGVFEHSEDARKISAARCARVSYLTQDGKRDHGADLALYRRLVDGNHMSPLEHVATPFRRQEWRARQMMARSVLRDVRANDGYGKINPFGLDNLLLRQLLDSVEFNGNFRGWTQLRKLVPNEHDFGLAVKS